jgi:hypothetical protein
MKAWGGKSLELQELKTVSALTPSETLLGHLFWGATDIRTVSDPKASIGAHEQKLELDSSPHVKTYAFSTPKMQRMGASAILGSLHFLFGTPRISPFLISGGRKLSPAVQLGISSPGQSKVMSMLQSLSVNLRRQASRVL